MTRLLYRVKRSPLARITMVVESFVSVVPVEQPLAPAISRKKKSILSFVKPTA